LRGADFGAAVRARRKAQGLRLEDLAEFVGVSRNRLQELEAKPTARLDLLVQVLRELGLEVIVRSRDPHRGEFR
jgi:transcriptional regulator with XRE-family HTH domain